MLALDAQAAYETANSLNMGLLAGVNFMLHACGWLEGGLVGQAVVIGDQRKFLSALLVPNFETLEEFARSRGIGPVGPDDLVRHPEVLQLFETIVEDLNKEMPGFSQVRRFTLLGQEFTQDGGELTPTMKVKRFAINRKYRAVIDAMYPEDLQDIED